MNEERKIILQMLQEGKLSVEDAERLIVIGFFQDVLDRSPVKGLAEQLGQAVAAKFARRSG